MAQLYELTITAAQKKLRAGEITSEALTESVLKRIAVVEDRVQAFISIQADAARSAARAADDRRAKGDNAPLLGIPIGIKDAIVTQNVTTTAGSKILENFVPPYDATVVSKLKKAGAIIIGKTNTDEFTMGSSTEFSAFHPTRNPWDLTRVPGGSSGGSTAAVAAHEALATLGTDTGGSIRQPAAFCGVVGLKPTYGRASRYGIIAHGSSLDQPGPITKSVTDAALMLQIIAGQDPHDATSLDLPVPDYVSALAENRGFDGMKIGVPKEFFATGLNPAIAESIHAALNLAEAQGAQLIEVSLPHTDFGIPTYYLISTAEASSNLSRYDGVRFGVRVPGETMWDTYFETRSAGFGAEVKRRIMLGTYALSAGYYDAYYLKAQKVRTLIQRDFSATFQKVDVIFAPTTPNIAFKLGQKIDDPLQMYLSDIYTVMANLAGIPGISIPAGFSDGMPIGLQILGPALGEIAILQAAHAFEQQTIWHQKYASL